jgi:hypothetical protein
LERYELSYNPANAHAGQVKTLWIASKAMHISTSPLKNFSRVFNLLLDSSHGIVCEIGDNDHCADDIGQIGTNGRENDLPRRKGAYLWSKEYDDRGKFERLVVIYQWRVDIQR